MLLIGKRFCFILSSVLVIALGLASSGNWSWREDSAAEHLSRKATGERTASPQELKSLREYSSDWPALFGPRQNSRSHENPNHLDLDWSDAGPPVKWRRPIGSAYSSPIVFRDRLILFYRVGDEEVLECRDAETGDSNWTFCGPTKFQDRFEYSSGPHATPVTDGKYVFAVGAEGRFYCVDLIDGQQVWSRFLTQEFDVPRGRYAVAGSPLLEGDLLIFNLGARTKNAGIIALDKRTGGTVWTATDHGAGLATPRTAEIHGLRHVFVFTFDGLVCLDPESGNVRWIEKYHANSPERINTTSPLISEDRVLVSAHFKGSLCLKVLPDGERESVWSTVRNLQSQYSTLIAADGFVYGFHAGNQTLRCLDLSRGTVQWEWPERGMEGIGRGSAIAVGNRLIVYGEHGHLASLEINPNRPVVQSLTANPLLKSPCYSSPAFANGLLFLTNELEVVCFDLRAKDHPAD